MLETTGEGQIFLSIANSALETFTSNIYTSDYRGFDFTLTLRYFIISGCQNFDFFSFAKSSINETSSIDGLIKIQLAFDKKIVLVDRKVVKLLFR